ncbi:MAG TPA: PEP-CTERM sorting domain-containing protein [Burkholderiaceae bacterium]|nr:PEP-CTERM sorting domain-containing protein [Burkholderiaceae bacterium]
MTNGFHVLACAAGLAVAGSVAAAPVQFADNGHYYEWVNARVSWDAAVAASAASSYLGMTGYLVTVTSDAESDFIYGSVTSSRAWAGGSDSEEEGVWKWITGPEAGTAFWSHGSTLTYARWTIGEPNDSGGGEHALVIHNLAANWNDEGGVNRNGYVIEYSAPVPEPSTYALFALGLIGIGLAARRR